jgi:hypothetical protein
MELIVIMDGELAELMCELNSKFTKNEDGVLYLKCIKALYGYIEAARLFYDDLDDTLRQSNNNKQRIILTVPNTIGRDNRMVTAPHP